MWFTVPSSAAEASGRRFYYLTGAAALLELALLQYAMHKAVSKVDTHTHTHTHTYIHTHCETSLLIYSAGVCPCHYTRYCQDWCSGELCLHLHDCSVIHYSIIGRVWLSSPRRSYTSLFVTSSPWKPITVWHGRSSLSW